MPKTGKRYAAARSGVPQGVKLTPDEAVKLVKEHATAKFDESVDVATRLGVDPRKADQLVRGTVVLPHGTGKSVRVLVIAQGEKEAEATAAGADYVGVEFVEKIQEGWLDFDVCVPPQCSPNPNKPFARPYCNETCRCTNGFGDCDGNEDCLPGFLCGDNNGPRYGQPHDWDICVAAHCRSWLRR